jgi:hypothetical protein
LDIDRDGGACSPAVGHSPLRGINRGPEICRRLRHTAGAMSEDAVSITHAEALRLIDEQVGERVYLALFVTRTESESGEGGRCRSSKRRDG